MAADDGPRADATAADRPAGREAGSGTVAPSLEAISPSRFRSAALTVILMLLVVGALRLARAVLVPLAFGVLLSYAVEPIVALVARRGLPRALSATLVLTALVGGAAWLGWGLRYQATDLAGELPRVAQHIRASVRGLQAGAARSGAVGKVQQAAKTIETAAAEATRPAPGENKVPRVQVEQPPVRIEDLLVSGTLQLMEVAGEAVVVFFLALYLLASGDLFKRKLVKLAGPSLSQKKVTVQILEEIDRQVAAFLLIRLVISLFVGVLTWLALFAIGLRQAGVWGVVAGVFNLAPYAGPTVVTGAVAVAAFVQFGSAEMALAAAGLTVAVATAEGYWLTPWLTGRAARMNSVAVFVGLLFWGWVWGVAGLLLAVPLLMVLKAICDRIEGLQPIGELLGE